MTDMENAEKLFQEYKVKEAYPLFEKLAGEGNPRAMYFMALFHQYYMECAPWSPKKAIEWALKGARLGDGLCGLFCLLHFNELSHEEYHEITDRREEWISLSQKDGSLYALEALGCYEMVNAQSEEEVDRAFHLLEEAALKNYWKAWNDLGQFHDSHVKDNPPLVRKKADNRKAIDCYRKSLEAGYPDAMNRLAYFYYTGVGVPQDKKEAYALFRKALPKDISGLARPWAFSTFTMKRTGIRKRDSASRRRQPTPVTPWPWQCGKLLLLWQWYKEGPAPCQRILPEGIGPGYGFFHHPARRHLPGRGEE